MRGQCRKPASKVRMECLPIQESVRSSRLVIEFGRLPKSFATTCNYTRFFAIACQCIYPALQFKKTGFRGFFGV